MMPKVIRLATQTPATEFIPSEACSWWHIQSGPTLETIKTLETTMDIKDTCWSLDQLANSTVMAQSNREAASSASNAILTLRNMLDLPASAKVDDIVAKVHQLMQQIPSAS
ncbi:hypothetical protein HBO10_29620 [Pseudomonas sp. WS 5503]|uniref:hypothetical protein n=1 Tax=Pseudomonas TaxID=286 RepID=UPI00147544A2|nr:MULTISPECIES: hypothetical protein [Pseudomonas]MBF6043423.1 hypothetical protein [Pseudomonas mucoides]NMX83667.1 hypothetical protein [Pseudomonas sp. WS 5503]NNB23625.1 hypothetical protein [Pseudomonas fragi]